MVPRTHDQEILFLCIVAFEQLIDFDRTVEIFLVPPSGHVERRHCHAIEPRCKRLPLPESVIVGMVYEVAPGWDLPLKILRVDVRERSEIQIPLVSIVTIYQGRNIG